MSGQRWHKAVSIALATALVAMMVGLSQPLIAYSVCCQLTEAKLNVILRGKPKP